MTSSKAKAPAVQFQASKGSHGYSPKASMVDTSLCQVCYPKGLPKAQVTSHHPRGRWTMASGQQVCTRHMKALQAKGEKLAPQYSRGLQQAKRQAKAKAQAKQA